VDPARLATSFGPSIIILAGVLPWRLGDFSFSHSLLLSIAVHAVSIGIGLVVQEPIRFPGVLVLGWIALPVIFSSDA
jgi:hypothetical protein